MMEKRVVRKDDGRYLIFYAFERPLPKVDPERATLVEAGARSDAGPGAGTGSDKPRQGGDA